MNIKLIICILVLIFSVGVYAEVGIDKINHINRLLKVSYRQDGVINIDGNYTLFENQKIIFESPGFNCSGFVLPASRILLNNKMTIDEARKDINGNSGKGAALGQDWDFGRDLIMNIAEPYGYTVILPNIEDVDHFDISADDSLGFSLHELANWEKVLKQVQPDNIYLVAFSRKTTVKGYRLLYYHVAVMVMDDVGAVWLYHATLDEGVHRIMMNSKEGMNKFQTEFKEKKGFPKKLLILEVKK